LSASWVRCADAWKGFPTSVAGRIRPIGWPILGWQHSRRFSCRARRFSIISDGLRSDMHARIAKPCSIYSRFSPTTKSATSGQQQLLPHRFDLETLLAKLADGESAALLSAKTKIIADQFAIRAGSLLFDVGGASARSPQICGCPTPSSADQCEDQETDQSAPTLARCAHPVPRVIQQPTRREPSDSTKSTARNFPDQDSLRTQ